MSGNEERTEGRRQLPMAPCGCSCSNRLQEIMPVRKVNRVRYFGTGLLCLLIWAVAYSALDPLSSRIEQAILSLGWGAAAAGALTFFLYDTAKILLLLVLMVYVISWLRAGLRAEKVRDVLAGKGRGAGYILGAVLGAITPFCSCSSIPLFLGFTSAGVPLGMTLSFLIASPLINEVAVVLLWGLLGWKFTALYVATGLCAGIAGGMVMDAIRAERWLRPLSGEGGYAGAGGLLLRKPGLWERHAFALGETRNIFRRVWPWVIAGVAVGAALHGLVPQEWFAGTLGGGSWWTVPVAVAAGVPLYANVTGIIPILESLLLKGLPVGTTLAFCMSTVAVSLPELLMLRQVMSWKLLAVFVTTLLILFTFVGWLFNAFPVGL